MKAKAEQKAEKKKVKRFAWKKDSFDQELIGKRVRITLLTRGDEVEAEVVECARYWLKIMVNGRVVYINKAFVVTVEPLG